MPIGDVGAAGGGLAHCASVPALELWSFKQWHEALTSVQKDQSGCGLENSLERRGSERGEEGQLGGSVSGPR